jgi:hypothetical protein
MTEANVALIGVIILAVLGIIAKALDYVNKSIFPELKTLFGNVSDLKTANAVTQQQNDQNTARLNGISARTETLMMASPGLSSASVNAGTPGNVTAEAAPAIADAPAPEALAPIEAPRPIHVTISADTPFSASDLAAAHVALDAHVLSTETTGGLPQ